MKQKVSLRLYGWLFEEEDPFTSSVPSSELRVLLDEYREVIWESFSKEEVRNWAKKRFTEAGYKYLGSGSYRIVFDLGNGTVIKLVLHSVFEKDMKIEIKNFQCLGSEYAPIVYDYDPNYLWVIYEKIRPFSVKSQVVQNRIRDTFEVDKYITDPEDISFLKGNYIDFVRFQGSRYIAKKLYRLNPKYKDFIDRLKSCQINPYDFYPRNIGFRGKKGFVILDATDFQSETDWHWDLTS